MKWICKCGTLLGTVASPDRSEFYVLPKAFADWMQYVPVPRAGAPDSEDVYYTRLMGRPEVFQLTMCPVCGRLWVMWGRSLLSFHPEFDNPQRLMPLPSEIGECEVTGSSTAYRDRRKETL
jgi:hypothetical protein